jgi:hypothetical protein
MRYIEEEKYASLIYRAARAGDLDMLQQYTDEFNRLNPDGNELVQQGGNNRSFVWWTQKSVKMAS